MKMKVKGWLNKIRNLLFQKSNKILNKADDTKDCPVVSPETECFVIRIVFKREIGFS